MTDNSHVETKLQPPPMPPVRRSRLWRRLALGILILVSGIAIGAAAGPLVARHWGRDRILQAVRHPEQTPALMAERLREDLDLSPEQTKQVEAIVSRRMEQMDNIRSETRPRVDEQFRLMNEEIIKVLTPDQAQKFRELLDKMERFRRHRPRDSGKGGPRGSPPGPSRDRSPDKGR